MKNIIQIRKKIFIAILFAMACLCMCFATTVKANAEIATKPNFYMIDGASVRIGNQSLEDSFAGLRFSTVITKEYFDSLGEDAELHTIYGPASKYADVESLTVENYAANDFRDYLFENVVLSTEEDIEIYQFNLVLDYSKLTTDSEKLQAYDMELMARSYVKTSTGTIIYAASADTVRSMKAVANAVLNDSSKTYESWEEDRLSKYITLDGNVIRSTNYVEPIDSNATVTIANLDTDYHGGYEAYLGAKKLSCTREGNVFTFSDLGQLEVGKSYEINLFNDNNEIITQPITYVTKVIKTATELSNLSSIYTTNGSNGYYALGADIICESANTNYSWTPFTGTFDGFGHSITNFTINDGYYGLFYEFGNNTNGIIKNVSFINAVNNSNSGLICQVNKGTVENVYVSLNMNSSKDMACVISADNGWGMKSKNVLVEYNNLTSVNGNGTVYWRLGGGLNNLHGVYGIAGNSICKVNALPENGENYGDNYGMYEDYSALNSNTDLSTWENSFWKVINGIPVPRRIADSNITVSATPATTEAATGASVSINNCGIYEFISINQEAINNNVTINGKKIYVPLDAMGTTINVKVTSLIDSTKNVNFNINVVNVINVAEKQEIDKKGTTASLDLGEYKKYLGNTVVSVTIGGVEISNAVIDANGVLTFGTTAISSLWGDNIAAIVTKTTVDGQDTKNVTINVVASVYASISTSEEFANLSALMVDYNGGKTGNFKLANDIDMQGATVRGFAANFYGSFDGNGHMVSNFAMTADTSIWSYQTALFGTMQQGAEVKNLTLYNVNLNSFSGAVISLWCRGNISNVVLHVNFNSIYGQTDASPANSSVGLVTKDVQGAYIKNVIVLVASHGLSADSYAAMFTANTDWGGTFENCIGVNMNGDIAGLPFSSGSGGTISNPTNDGSQATVTKTNVLTFANYTLFNNWTETADGAAAKTAMAKLVEAGIND